MKNQSKALRNLPEGERTPTAVRRANAKTGGLKCLAAQDYLRGKGLDKQGKPLSQ